MKKTLFLKAFFIVYPLEGRKDFVSLEQLKRVSYV